MSPGAPEEQAISPVSLMFPVVLLSRQNPVYAQTRVRILSTRYHVMLVSTGIGTDLLSR